MKEQGYKQKITIKDEGLFLHNIFNNVKYFDMIDKSFFSDVKIGRMFEISKDEIKKSKKRQLPEYDMLANIILSSDYNDTNTAQKIDENFLNNFFKLEDSYDKNEETVKRRFDVWKKFKKIENTLYEQTDKFREINPLDSDTVDTFITTSKKQLQDIIEISYEDDDLGMDFDDLENRKYDINTLKNSTGYPCLDEICDGGFDCGSLIVFIGQTNVGKCVSPDTLITVKNNITNMVKRLTILEFYKLIQIQNEII